MKLDYEFIGNRKYANTIFNQLINNNDDVLDFENVKFVSYSFVNEFSYLEKKNKVMIKKINMNNNIKYMFSIANKKLNKNNILSYNNYKTISLNEICNPNF